MSAFLKLKFSQHDGFVPVTVIQITGELDGNTYLQFQSRALQEIEAGMHYALLDLGQLSYISSAGLRAIYMIAKELAAKGIQTSKNIGQTGSFKSPYLKLLDPSPVVNSALEVMGLTMSLEIYNDRDKALVSFSSNFDSGHVRVSNNTKTSSITEELKQTFRASGAEVESQRIELLRGKRFLFVMGGYPGKRPLYEHAHALGVSMVVLDGPGHWAQDAVKEGLFEKFIEVDLFPTESLAERAFAAVQETGMQFDGVATIWDNAGPLAALLANELGLPGHPLLSIGFSKNKVFTREVCMETGIPSPRFFRIKSMADLDTAAAHVGFPAVLKPNSGMGSLFTYLVKDETDLRQRYQKILADVDGHLKDSAVRSDDFSELIWARGLDMTLEEFLDGEEFDVDMLLSEGEPVYAGVTRDLPQPYMIETGSQMPPSFPLDKQDELVDFTARVLRALGFTNGTFHVESKYTSNGPRLIEVNARIGGGPIYFMNRQVWGVDLVEQYLLTCLGIPILPQKAVQPLKCILTSDLSSPYSGVVTHDDFLQSISNHPQVIHCKTAVKVGQKVTGPDRGIPDSLGEVMVYGATVEEASQTMDELLAQIKFPIETDVTL